MQRAMAREFVTFIDRVSPIISAECSRPAAVGRELLVGSEQEPWSGMVGEINLRLHLLSSVPPLDEYCFNPNADRRRIACGLRKLADVLEKASN